MSNQSEDLCDICKQPLVGEEWQDYDDNGDDLGYDAHVSCLKTKGLIS